MGETVNTASRIESVGHLAEVEPPLQTRILVSAATAECLAGIVSLEEKKTFITVKEFAGRVFEVLGMATEGLRPAGQGEEQAASVTHA